MNRQSSTKRFMDVAGAGLGLAIAAIPMGLIWASVRGALGKPALFRQIRLGRHGRPFQLYKFKTMTNQPLKSEVGVADEKRLRPIGRFLRRSSLDELPELLNVLKGDMSLVGPRPLLPQYLERYTPKQARRHDVKPGITGWAQVNGRNALTWEQKFELDIWYVDHRSFRLDLRILGMTLIQMLRREGINAPGHATMPEFMGTEDG